MMRKRKRSPASSPSSSQPPPPRSCGFSDKDQRLPPSPPLPESRHGLMAAVRARYRNALDLLFGVNPNVLNTACVHFNPRGTQRAVPSKRTCSETGDKKRRGTDSETDQVVPEKKRQRVHADSVPEKTSPAHETPPRTPNFSKTTCTSPSTCICSTSLWNADGIDSEMMLRTAEELSDSIISLYARCISPESADVDYSALVHLPNFHNYLASARKLRYFDPLLLNDTERKAFFLNIYNSLMIHAIAVMSKPRTMFERVSLYNVAAYTIGGRNYTLNMIEHGVLRANRPGAGPFAQPQFSQEDPRRQCCLPSVDARIHFALNCGARSCPAIRFYEPKNLERTLDSATRIYLDDIKVDVKAKKIVLPKLLQWYKADFCDDDDLLTVVKWTLKYLSKEKKKMIEQLIKDKEEDGVEDVVISFAQYDWTINDSLHVE